MQLIHQNSGQVVCPEIKLATSILQRFFGLMGKPALPTGQGLWLEPCDSIHSCFMRFCFDAIFLSKEGEIVHLIQGMRPWRMSPILFKSNVVVELPQGSIEQAGLKIGDKLSLKKL
jgi:hypothetical protein